MTKNLSEKYRQEKADFLDSLQPDDFRNGASFNQAEQIIDQLHKALLKHVKNNDDHHDFIAKAVSHLFRENSPAIAKAIALSNSYLEMHQNNFNSSSQ